MGSGAQARPVAETVTALGSAATRLGDWVARIPYWALFAVIVLAVLIKSGFKWAGTTGEGWFIEFSDVIEAWPLKESLPNAGGSAWMENYSSIVAFRAFDAIGFPHNSATWNFVHMLVTGLTVVYLGWWARRTFGDRTGRIVLLLVMFGAVPMVLLQEIGRYDSLFFLGAVLVATFPRWWGISVGVLLLGTSSWAMAIGFSISLVLAGLVLGSRALWGRGLLGFLACAIGAGGLMVLRALQGGEPWLDRLGRVQPGGDREGLAGIVYQMWNNMVQPFPNWIWAAYGITWVLFVVVVAQAGRRAWLLAVVMLAAPVLAGAANAGDGTREIAFTLGAVLLGVATVLRRSTTSQSATGEWTPSGLLMGLVAVACLVIPVVIINPSVPLNPYGWLSDYGLSIVVGVLGQG